MKRFLAHRLEQIKNKFSNVTIRRDFGRIGPGACAYVRRMITAIIDTQDDEVEPRPRAGGARAGGDRRHRPRRDRRRWGSRDGTRAGRRCGRLHHRRRGGGSRRRGARRSSRRAATGCSSRRPTHIFAPEWQADAWPSSTGRSPAVRPRRSRRHSGGGRLSAGPFTWLRGLIRGGSSARLVAKTAWLAETSPSTPPASVASPVSGARRGAA